MSKAEFELALLKDLLRGDEGAGGKPEIAKIFRTLIRIALGEEDNPAPQTPTLSAEPTTPGDPTAK